MFPIIDEVHQKGNIFIETVPEGKLLINSDLGIQIAPDGRVWICIDGVAFLRFSPYKDGRVVKKK